MQHARRDLHQALLSFAANQEVILIVGLRHLELFQDGFRRFVRLLHVLAPDFGNVLVGIVHIDGVEDEADDLVSATQARVPDGAAGIDLIDHDLVLPQEEADAPVGLRGPVGQVPAGDRLVARGADEHSVIGREAQRHDFALVADQQARATGLVAAQLEDTDAPGVADGQTERLRRRARQEGVTAREVVARCVPRQFDPLLVRSPQVPDQATFRAGLDAPAFAIDRGHRLEVRPGYPFSLVEIEGAPETATSVVGRLRFGVALIAEAEGVSFP